MYEGALEDDSMPKVLDTLAITILGCGLLAGAPEDPVRLHESVRARVQGAIGGPMATPDQVRALLREDPDFARLLEAFRRRVLASLRDSRYGEDAFQDALLKTWRGRPDLFLQSHEDVLRYLRAATRMNRMTLWRKWDRAGVKDGDADAAVSRDVDPEQGVVAEDLLRQLWVRLGPEERRVLSCRLAGARSERRVAAAAGLSRHAAARASARIRREWRRMAR
jgi:DNA-directed RNA polymerase specialized sigma24 family protein